MGFRLRCGGPKSGQAPCVNLDGLAQAWVSFDAVKAEVPIEDVLHRYGLIDALQQKGVQLVGHCPFHKDSKPSFKVTPERNI